MLENLIPLAAFLTQFFSEKLLERGLDHIRFKNVKEKLNTKIQVALKESIIDLPDGEYIIENFDFIGLLRDSIVQNELSLLVRPSDNREPNIEVLQDAWERKLGNQLPGNYQIILARFLRALRQRLGEIEEIQELLHYKDQQIIVTQLRQIGMDTHGLLDKLTRFINSDLGLTSSNTIRATNIPPADSIPLPSVPFLLQEGLIQTLLDELDSYPWLALIDGPGKGKTQLAATIAKRNFRQAKWISLRNKGQNSQSHFRDQFALWLIELSFESAYWFQYLGGLSPEMIAEIVGELSTNAILIIDDLPDPVDFESFYLELEVISQILITHNIKIITTGQRGLPPFIENRFLTFITKKSRPAFSPDDIHTILLKEKAPDYLLKEGVVNWITATTRGHPSLVAATLKWLEQSGWDNSLTTIDGLISGEPFKETLAFSRRHLISQLSDSQKELLYRLSILGENFTREQALEIANISPKITNPGNVLDFLVGPWLDVLENQKLNVTPLLVDSGKENLTFKVQQAVHRLWVKQLTFNKVIEITNAHSLLIHLWQASDYMKFGQVLLQLMISVETEAQAKYIDWTTGMLLGVDWPNEINLDMRLIIRVNQVKVAVIAGRTFGRLIDDLEILLKQATPEDNLFSIFMVHSLLGIMIREIPLEVSIPKAFSSLRLYLPNKDHFRQILEENRLSLLPDLVLGKGLAIKHPEHLMLFLEELSKLSAIETEYLFAASLAPEVSEHLMNLIPSSEALLPVGDRNWEKILIKLNELDALSVVQKNLYLKLACARARSIVFADFLKNFGEAIKIMDVFSDVSDPNVVFLTNYSRGCYSSADEKVTQAIEYFTRAESSMGEAYAFYRVDNTRRLAIEKSRNKEWTDAKELCIATIRKFRAMDLEESSRAFIWDTVEMLGELAFIYWNLGDLQRVVTCFYGYGMKLVASDNTEDLRYKESFNKAGHGLGWFIMMIEKGNPPPETIEGETYAPVTAGLFGIRREVLGEFVPPLGFSKALLLNQMGRALYAVGIEKLAWHTNKMSISHYQSESQENGHGLILVYPDIAILEMVYGDGNVAMNYALLTIKFWAAARTSVPDQSRDGFRITQPVDFSLTTEDDLRAVERHMLYMFFTPVLLSCLSLNLSETQIEKKFSLIENWLNKNQANLFYADEWLSVIIYFRDLINYPTTKTKPNINFEVFGDRTTFQILWLFISSLHEKIPLGESFTNQVRSLVSLVSYNSMCTRMLPGIGRLLYAYWINVSINQRFALHDPRGFAESMNSISPSLGGRTIVKIIKAVSTALQIRVPLDTMQNLEALVFI